MNLYDVDFPKRGTRIQVRASNIRIAAARGIDAELGKRHRRGPTPPTLTLTVQFVRKIKLIYTPRFYCARRNSSEHWETIRTLEPTIGTFRCASDAEKAGEKWIELQGYNVWLTHPTFGEYRIASPGCKTASVEA